jgi:hypothetical protein
MRAVSKHTRITLGVLCPAMSLCLFSSGLIASENAGSVLLFASETMGLVSEGAPASAHPPYPMVLDPGVGMDFDLGGSDKRKLQLLLDQPLSLNAGVDTRILDNGSDMLGLDATLAMPLSRQFSLEAGVDRRTHNTRFQPLGNIQCQNGTLRADSYTASGCRFINEPLATDNTQQFSLGARLDLRHASASVNWFTRDTELSQPGAGELHGGRSVMSSYLLSPNLGNPLLSTGGSDPLRYLNSEASGVDLNFKVGIATDTRGDLQLGLAFSRVLDADFGGLYARDGNTLSWTLAEPFNTARMNLEWSRGAFSTGIQGYYRDSVDFLDRTSLDSMTTFDVHFTWRTPWNANLSLGASNVLNAGSDSAAATDNQPADPLEPIYGRIPYVRYKQDL